ncbi:MAG: glucosaminidase domain-containing protein [Saprospiraceae bacterium]|jgi:flagellum-specific peptidoglycan hydrolase FlgJ
MNTLTHSFNWSVWFAYNWHRVLLVLVAFTFLNREGLLQSFSPLTQIGAHTESNRPAYADTRAMPVYVVNSEKPPIVKHQTMNASLMSLLADKASETSTHTVPAAAPKNEAPALAFNGADVEEFLDRFGDVARNEHHRYGVPASVTLAAALLQSKAGITNAAKSVNNFFQLPCTNDWIGPEQHISGHCLRKYETAWLSFRDHTLFLTSGRFADIKERFDPQDYKSWCMEMEARGYPGGPQIAQSLIRTIEQYQLTNWD